MLLYYVSLNTGASLNGGPEVIRPLRIENLLHMRWVNEPQVSPDGSRILFVQTDIDPQSWTYRSHIVLIEGGRARALSEGAWRDRSPRWSPDGTRVAFVSDREQGNQVWIHDLRDGRLQRLTDLPLGVAGAPSWTPDGQHVVIGGFDRHAPGSLAQPGEPEPDVRVIRQLDYKADATAIAHGASGATAGFRDDRRRQIFRFSLTGEVLQLTSGDYDHVQPAVSPDGAWVGFVAHRDAEADRTAVRYLWRVSLDGTRLERLAGGWGPISSWAWDPDGAGCAFIGHVRRDQGQDRLKAQLFTFRWGDDEPTCLTENFEPTIGIWARSDFRLPDTSAALQWTRAGLHFLASWAGRSHLYRLTPGGGCQALTTGDRAVFSFHAAPGGTAAYAAQSAVEPGDIYARDGTGSEVRLTQVNGDLLGEVTLSTPIHFQFKGTLGQDVDAWLMPPVPCEPGKRYPLILQTHRGAFGEGFYHEFHALCGRGYAVLYCNHVGAQGYGQDYALAQHLRWGGPDVEEMLRAVETAVERFPFVDGERVGTTGPSAGGFYSNWLAAHSDRFKAVVTQASICNWTSMYGTSDIGPAPYVVSELGGHPWDAGERYRTMSPLTYADRVRAPVLIIHGDQDHRCPIGEAEQWFRALRYLGCTVEFVWFQGESHSLSRTGRPVNRIERLRRIAAWFDRYLSKAGDN